MTMSLIRGRAENAKLAPEALAYYDRAGARVEAGLPRQPVPYKRGAKPVKFNFDFSYNYYPSAFDRPGPRSTIYRLRQLQAGLRAAAEGTRHARGAGTS